MHAPSSPPANAPRGAGALVVAAALLLGGCNGGRAAECRSVTGAIRDSQAELGSMQGEPDLAKLRAQAEKATAFATRIGEIRVRDPKLKELVEQYHAMAVAMAELLAEASRGEMTIDTYTRRTQALQQTDDDVVARLNGYCDAR